MRLLAIVVATSVLAAQVGCAVRQYRPAPLSPAESAASLDARSLADPALREFYAKMAATPPAAWPPSDWNLADLTVAAFYFNPAVRVAKARVAEAEAAVVTAGTRPNPTLRGDLGGETAAESPWLAGVGFSIPIETAGKRRDRVSRAEQLAEAARWDLAATAWKVRSQVRRALLDDLVATRSLELLATEEQLRAERVRLLEQRLAVGLIARPDVDAAAIEHTRTLLALRTAEGRARQAEISLAAAIGLPAAALHAVTVDWPAFDRPPRADTFAAGAIRGDAALNRIDIRRGLAEYAASEAALRLEIAKQYPDFDIGPTYAFEEGLHLFSIALGLTLPVFNRNQGPIAEAEARREQAAAQFLAVQAAGVTQAEQALARYTAALAELAQADRLIQQAAAQDEAVRRALAAGEGDRVALNGVRLQKAAATTGRLDALTNAQQALGDLEDAVQRPLLPGDIQPLSARFPVLR